MLDTPIFEVMNRLVTFIFIASLFLQCAATREAPEFLGIEKLTVTRFKGKTADLNGDAVFYNPNKRGMTLREVAIDVKTEDRVIGQINKSLNLKIQPESEFKVPLDATIQIGDIGVIKGILSIFGGNEIEINYSGVIKVSVYGVPRKLHIDHTEQLQF